MFKRFALLMLSLLGIVSIVAAQTVCPDIVQDALSAIDDECTDVARNQACYGNGMIEVVPQTGTTLDEFNNRGDQIAIVDVESLALSELDEALEEWGVALLSIQANLPESLPGQNLTVLLFGDVSIENAGDAMEAFYFTSGIGEAGCNEAPNGILIQSPEDAGTIELTINDVGIELGSTAYITAEAEGLMTFALLEGSSDLTADDTTVSLEPGTFSTIELDEDGLAIGAPSEPQAIEGNLDLPQLPLYVLPRDIEAEDETASTDGNASGRIIPLTGDWTYTPGEVELTGGCPPQMASALEVGMGSTDSNFVDFGGENFEFQTWFAANTQGAFVGGEFSSPTLNQYVYTTTIEGTIFTYDMTFLSGSEIEGSYFMDFGDLGMDCEVSVAFTVSLDD